MMLAMVVFVENATGTLLDDPRVKQLIQAMPVFTLLAILALPLLISFEWELDPSA